MPAALRSYLDGLRDARDGVLDWRRVLRLFAASSRRSRIRATLRRPSRRYHTFPGIRVSRGQRMAVCVDTSGSVGDRELAEFFAEVHAIWRAGAEVVVFEADAAVHRTWEYTGQPPASAHGRGGTSFDPALAAVRAAAPRFDACVYLTDGHAPRPRAGPGVPLLWLLTLDGKDGDHLAYGASVKIR
jgi:predicted metal-dependent peptidase